MTGLRYTLPPHTYTTYLHTFCTISDNKHAAVTHPADTHAFSPIQNKPLNKTSLVWYRLDMQCTQAVLITHPGFWPSNVATTSGTIKLLGCGASEGRFSFKSNEVGLFQNLNKCLLLKFRLVFILWFCYSVQLQSSNFVPVKQWHSKTCGALKAIARISEMLTL